MKARRIARELALVAALVAGAAGFLLSCAGCASAFDIAKQTEGAISEATAAVATEWIDYDKNAQLELVHASTTEPEARAKLADYREHVQTPVQTGMHALRTTLDGLGQALNASGAAQRKDWSAAIGPAIAAALDLAQLLQSLHVPLTSLTQLLSLAGGK